MRLKKKQKDFSNVAIKRVKSNALALALSSDSNIDEVNNAKHAKVLKAISKSVRTWNFRSCLIRVSYCKHKVQGARSKGIRSSALGLGKQKPNGYKV